MSTDTGRRAEAEAAIYLQKQGLKLLARNWRSRWAEIDLIATDKAGTVHFIEVKYRKTESYGTGFEYITADKAQRLRRAALYWMAQFRPDNHYLIGVVSVTGDINNPTIDYLPNAVTG